MSKVVLIIYTLVGALENDTTISLYAIVGNLQLTCEAELFIF